jgi:hypothetical protein
MKKLTFVWLFFLTFSLFAQNTVEYSLKTRIWSNKGEDEGSIHPIGNGNMLVYGQGPNIDRLFGPPYSSPSYLQMFLSDTARTLRVESKREKNTAIWHHKVYNEDRLIAQMVDYILPDKNVFFRDVEVKENLTFSVTVPPEINAYPMEGYFNYIKNESVASVLLSIPMGTLFFVRNPIPEELSMFIAATGSIEISDPVNAAFNINLKPGKGRLIFSSSKAYPKTVDNIEQVLKSPETVWLDQSRKYWYDFSSRRFDFSSKIPMGHPLRDSILDAIDGVSVLIKCQQSSSGGVMAGHIYNMAYVRDQSGVLRGLLALGYIPEARAILDFWMHKFDLFGNVLCADGMGNDAARLLLTNDEVEVPAYIVQDCFLYYEQTKDNDFLKKAFPMMEWAFEVQLSHLVEGMTEFSGDETYIAGGILPRSHVYDGSAESTLLFITGGGKLIDWASREGLWAGEKLEKFRQRIAYAREKYKSNFMDSGKLYANNPLRVKESGEPRFRYGFCDAHSDSQKTFIITWTENDHKGHYICPDCKTKVLPDNTIERDIRYVLNSVYLLPVYLQSDLFTSHEIETMVSPGIELFKAKGSVPSNIEGIRSLGYDYGLLLYNMVKLNNPLKEQLLRKTLSILDPTGGWVEYYDNDIPYNCRTRPWESGINIEAVIEYIKALQLGGF